MDLAIVDLSDDEIVDQKDTSVAGGSETTDHSDLIAVLQEKEIEIKSKSSEIQRLKLLNRDLESEVVF